MFSTYKILDIEWIYNFWHFCLDKLTGNMEITPTAYNEDVFSKIRNLSWKFTIINSHINNGWFIQEGQDS